MSDDDRDDDLDETIEDLEAPAAEQSDVAGGAMRLGEACKAGTPTCYQYSCNDTAVFCGNPESKLNVQRLG